MLSPKQKSIWRKRLVSPTALFFLSALVTWPILSELEAFEVFYEFSRDHESWEVDEIALLILNLTIALGASVWYKSRSLKLVLQARELERERAEKNARHDPLTGLMNRRAFYEMIENLSNRGGTSKASQFVGLVDLDRFKPVNDVHGHAAGDVTLCSVADRLRNEIGQGGHVARLGGDEFVIVFAPKMNAADVERVSRRMLSTIAQAIPFNGQSVFVGASIGLVHWDGSLGLSEMMRRADHALYQVKLSGRGSFAWYDSDADKQALERAEIAAELKSAVQSDKITPYYQPIVKIGTSELVGFEVLARWTHPTRGNVPPFTFIPIAEDSGLIGQLGMSILRQACADAADWPEELSISFNVSPIQFRDPALVESIQNVLHETGFKPERLTIEITESSVIDDVLIARPKIEAFKELGIQIALDDFGTGYSSLSCLRSLPFDRIKIDRSFVTDISSNQQNQQIVSGILSLANGLALDVTAEGIETSDDLAYLQGSTCSLGQGYYFEKPIPADQISWLLETEWAEHLVHAVPAVKAVG
ncbi:putative bifunctional diguanylate cyclase/phosphodiesterase [Shimia sp. Alg240-R146]|uniref:putative bifunctional diguanylate cyclase/phosphodiesterase n=1 Tax=Shimia sp. Alg240-R146 TaxID=2993449 RepID=UPI0022E60543|nr:EAL domain-containing protein [Shimia sp. Alg240-R146]